MKGAVAINVGVNAVINEEKIIALLRQDGNMSADMLVGYLHDNPMVSKTQIWKFIGVQSKIWQQLHL